MAEENNPNYNDMVQSLNTVMSGFNVMTAGAYEKISTYGKVSYTIGLSETLSVFDSQAYEWSLPGV